MNTNPSGSFLQNITSTISDAAIDVAETGSNVLDSIEHVTTFENLIKNVSDAVKGIFDIVNSTTGNGADDNIGQLNVTTILDIVNSAAKIFNITSTVEPNVAKVLKNFILVTLLTVLGNVVSLLIKVSGVNLINEVLRVLFEIIVLLGNAVQNLRNTVDGALEGVAGSLNQIVGSLG